MTAHCLMPTWSADSGEKSTRSSRPAPLAVQCSRTSRRRSLVFPPGARRMRSAQPIGWASVRPRTIIDCLIVVIEPANDATSSAVANPSNQQPLTVRLLPSATTARRALDPSSWP